MPEPGLRRELGVWASAAIVVGTVIGSGIFLVPKTMVQNTGSVEMVYLVWIFGGLLSLAGALTYAELSAMMPEAGGEYVYLREAYGPFWGFTYAWTQTWVAKSGSIATLAVGLTSYLANFLPVLENNFLSVPLPWGSPLTVTFGQIVAIALILFLGGVNWLGVRVGGQVQLFVTILKVALILGIVAVGLGSGKGSVSNFASSTPAPGGITGFFAALVAALWAYDGWNNVSMVSSEIKNPQRNLPRALIFGTSLVLVIYLLTNVAYFYVLPASEVAQHDRVASMMMQQVVGDWGAAVVSIAAMISMFAALNGSLLSGARVPYAAAVDGLFFAPFRRVHPVRHAPGFSIIALSIWAGVLVILVGGYTALLTTVIFPSWILYGMATASVIVLRRKRPNLDRPYKTVGYPVIPMLFVFVAILLLGITLVNSPRESGIGLVIIAAGIPFYLRWRNRANALGTGITR